MTRIPDTNHIPQAGTAMAVWVVVPAAGVGARMAADRPKQYLPLLGKPVIQHTLEKLRCLPGVCGIVVALDEADDIWPTTECAGWPDVFVVAGGANRAASVRNGLQFVLDQEGADSWVLVHDAARPCVSTERISALLDLSHTHQQGAILAARAADTVKRSKPGEGEGTEVSATEDRSLLWLAHTPQCFPAQQLLQALIYCEQNSLEVTDEASAVEQIGQPVLLCEDRRDNIKITLPEDLPVAQAILENQQTQSVDQ